MPTVPAEPPPPRRRPKVAPRQSETTDPDEDVFEEPTDRWERLFWYQKVAEYTFAVALTVFGGWARLQDLVENWAVGFPSRQLTFGLLILSVGLAFLWYSTTNQELQQLRRVGEQFVPDVPRYVAVLIVVATITLVLLFVTSAWPLAFALTLLGLKTIESWNSWLAKRRIGPGIRELLDSPTESPRTKARAQVLWTYYFVHPWDQLLASETMLIAIAVGVGAAALASPDTGLEGVGTSVAALILIVAVVANELVAVGWRRTRDAGLRPGPAASISPRQPM